MLDAATTISVSKLIAAALGSNGNYQNIKCQVEIVTSVTVFPSTAGKFKTDQKRLW